MESQGLHNKNLFQDTFLTTGELSTTFNIIFLMFSQVNAVIQILKHFGWTWVGLLVTNDDYGFYVAQSFQSSLSQQDAACLAYVEVLPWDSKPGELKRIVNLIKTSTARVVIVFAHEIHTVRLIDEVRMNA